MNPEEQSQFFAKSLNTIKEIAGIDYVYILNQDLSIFTEEKVRGNDNHLKEVTNILKSESLIEKIGMSSYSKPFHTYTFLNESGLVVVVKLQSSDTFYMVIIAGENEPVDLINLLKICKETRLSFNQYQETVA